jgi:CxC4 like cysteine cluster associated with KDZ transposases
VCYSFVLAVSGWSIVTSGNMYLACRSLACCLCCVHRQRLWHMQSLCTCIGSCWMSVWQCMERPRPCQLRLGAGGVWPLVRVRQLHGGGGVPPALLKLVRNGSTQYSIVTIANFPVTSHCMFDDDCYCRSCDNRLLYDGGHDGVFNYSNRTLVLHEVAQQYVDRTIEGQRSFCEHWRNMKRAYTRARDGDLNGFWSRATHRYAANPCSIACAYGCNIVVLAGMSCWPLCACWTYPTSSCSRVLCAASYLTIS